MLAKREHDKIRNKEESRVNYNKGIDRVRDKQEERLIEKRKHDQIRDKQEERLVEKRKHDQIRDKQEERLEEKRKHDQIRDKQEPRITEKRKHDKIRNQEEDRKQYNQSNARLQYQKKLRATYLTDTGFDVICSCCLQYKNEALCKNIDVLSAKQQRDFTVKNCDLLRNRSGNFFICMSCKSDIDKDKMPKKSHKQSFKFANFPQNLINNLKQTCKTPISSLSKH